MAKKKKELHGIDANNWVNRAFHSSPNWAGLTNGKGQTTGGIKTFIGMLNKLLNTNGLDNHYALVWDNKRDTTFRWQWQRAWMDRGTNRDKAYKYNYLREGKSSDYKGNRGGGDPEKELALRTQTEYCFKIAKALGFLCLKEDGYEADDLAGSLIQVPKAHIYLHTRDKDYNQLVSDRCTVINPEQANSTLKTWTPDSIVAEFGITPNQFLEYLMLMGDSADNIMGVPGVGSKTALKLLQEFESVNKIIEAAPSQKSKAQYWRCLRSDEGFIKPPFNLTRRLVTIDTKAPVPTKLSAYKLAPPNVAKLKKLKKKLKLNDLIYV